MRRLAIAIALVLGACDDNRRALPEGPGDRDRCLAAATAVGGLEPAVDLAGLAANAALVAATARTTPVDDDRLAAALRDLDRAATAIVEAAGAGDRDAAIAAGRDAATAYRQIDDAAQGMETAECGRRSWGAEATALPP